MNEQIYITDAISSLRPGSIWTLRGVEIQWEPAVDASGNDTGEFVATNLEWHSADITQPTKAEIEAEYIRLQAEYEAKQYQRLRRPEYPPLADLADALYWQAQGDESKMTAYLAAVEAVKQKYPKGV